MFLDKILETGWRSKNNGMPARHQTEREREERLYIAARTVGEDGDVHKKWDTGALCPNISIHFLPSR